MTNCNSEAKRTIDQPIRSSLANDPDMAEILALFIGDAPEKIERLRRALRSHDNEEIRTFAHQLKGAAAGYGFEELSKLARDLETAAKENSFQEISDQAERVIGFLSSITQ